MTPTQRKVSNAWPTPAELDILRVLWEHSDCTVREVHEKLYGNDGAGYTAALKLLQIMHAKGLVERDDSQRAHVYRSAIDQQRTQSHYLSDMTRRLFNGSTSQLVLQALGSHPETSREELKEIRAMLREIEAKGVER